MKTGYVQLAPGRNIERLTRTLTWSWKGGFVQKKVEMIFSGIFMTGRKEILAYTPVIYNYATTLRKPLIIPAGVKKFLQENNCNKAPLCRGAVAMNEYKLFIHYMFYC